MTDIGTEKAGPTPERVHAHRAAQAEHERLQNLAREHWEQTGEELSTGQHYGDCWCCCWDDPCESTPMV